MASSPNVMKSIKQDIYDQLTRIYTRAFPSKSKQQVQIDVNNIWNGHKNSDDFENKIFVVINEFKDKAIQRELKIKQYWLGLPKSSKDDEPVRDIILPVLVEKPLVQEVIVKPSTNYPKPAQQKTKEEIELLNADLVGLYKRKSVGMLTEDQEKELKGKEATKKKLQKTLNNKIADAKRSQKNREKQKENLQNFLTMNPESSKILKVRSQSGRPRIEESQPLLLETITEIAVHGSAAHERRHSDVYRSIKTLDELLAELVKHGFHVSRSGVYLRLLPKRSSSLEGKRHVKTCPVKLLRSQNDKHLKHIDGRFCTATIRSLEELASFLGPTEVCFLSQDDKARVCIGLTAAKLQSPMLMHVKYRAILPDHDWVVAAKHKLIPSVYAGIIIKPNSFGKADAVGYSGNTYIAIRSGKHSSSNPFSHCSDIEKLIEMPEFDEITKHNGVVKPVFIITVDGGPDENPRYEKVIKVAIHHFVKYNLDALFIASNAPGRSCFNRVERRMAPLSRELSGLILPYDHFGTHLNNQGKTVDEQLEKKNFQFAGETLGEIWSQVNIDNHPTKAEYILPENSEKNINDIISKDVQWMTNHVQTSQYFTQIVKCKDETCCSKPRSSLFKILKGFIPAPIPLQQTNEGVVASNSASEENKDFASLFLLNSVRMESILPSDFQKFSTIPYDLYCPSIRNTLESRICKTCSKYFASLVLLKDHTKNVHKKILLTKKIRPIRVAARRANELMAIIAREGHEDVEWVNEEDVENGAEYALELISKEKQEEQNSIPVLSVSNHFKCEWINE